MKDFKVVQNKDKGKDYGFVQYESLASYQMAMNSGRVNGDVTYHTVNGVEIQCKNASDKTDKVRRKCYSFSEVCMCMCYGQFRSQ